MVAIAFVFPGQGSQSVGMQTDIAAAFPVVRETYREAGDALSLDLWRLVSDGPAADLDRTEITQPAMLSAGVAAWRVANELGDARPQCLAGHSLGEWTALTAAGALAFADALRLVAERGRLMQDAVPAGTGAMAVIIGLDDDKVRAACAEAAEGDVVQAVNFNSPGQVVIAGATAAVERACGVAKDNGARRAMTLPVSVPSHCDLMRPAAERLAGQLDGVTIAEPELPVVNNVDVRAESAPEAIRAALLRQLYSPVRWVETVEHLRDAHGVTALVECGPGRVLAGLTRRIDKTLGAHALDSTEGFKGLGAVFS
ncbi:MAG: ACP S-malonyltransferase [Pseudomonadota bacterium]